MRSIRAAVVLSVVLSVFAAACVIPPDPPVDPPAEPRLVRVSVASDGTQGDLDARHASMSADGRYVTFESISTNLVAGDTNDTSDVFVRDRVARKTTRVSVASDGTEGTGRSVQPDISADGRYIAFVSAATNLVADDTNGRDDVFVHDRVTGTTERVSVRSDGAQAGADGSPAISADGRYVAFESGDPNLVTPADSDYTSDVFVHDRDARTTTKVSVAPDGTQADSYSQYVDISADGQVISYLSDATNLVAGDTNGMRDVFVYNQATGTTSMASVATDGTQGELGSGAAAISADGRHVAFESGADAFAAPGAPPAFGAVYVRDLTAGVTSLASVTASGDDPDSGSALPTISGDGRYVAFRSGAANFVDGPYEQGDNQFVRDMVAGVTTLVEIADPAGTLIKFRASSPVISDNGRYVAFDVVGSHLIPDDTNDRRDVFVYDLEG